MQVAALPGLGLRWHLDAGAAGPGLGLRAEAAGVRLRVEAEPAPAGEWRWRIAEGAVDLPAFWPVLKARSWGRLRAIGWSAANWCSAAVAFGPRRAVLGAPFSWRGARAGRAPLNWGSS